MAEELTYYKIFKGLNSEKIEYVVVGGLAVNFHGVPRMTYDIDIYISLKGDNVKNAFNTLSKWGFRLKQPISPDMITDKQKRERLIEEKNLHAITFYHPTNPLAEIDLLIDAPIPFSEISSRAMVVRIDDIEVSVISVPDLITFKIHAGRNQDLADIEHLRRLYEEERPGQEE